MMKSLRSSLPSSCVGVLGALALLGGCAATNYPQLASSDALSANSVTDVDFDYQIGPGDQLEIFVWGYPDLSVIAPVRPDGRITTRLVEDMQASGRSPTELAREIEKRYAEYVTAPVVTVGIANVVGTPQQRIRVIKSDGTAFSIAYATGMTLLDLLIEIGGLGEFANGNRTVLVRGAGADREKFAVRAGDLVSDGDMSADVALQPGDVVIVPKSWF